MAKRRVAGAGATDLVPEREREVAFTLNPGERIVEGRSVRVRDRGLAHDLHVLIVETIAKRSGRKRLHAIVECPTGMAIPGKGENAWDCDDNAIYGASFKAASVKDAVRSFVADVRKARKRGR
jgi:hypothetical protein